MENHRKPHTFLQIAKFLSPVLLTISGNKAAIVAFFFDYSFSFSPSMLLRNQRIIVVGRFHEDQIAKLITAIGASTIQRLFSIQE
jgi:hypothetical protein